MRIAFAKWVNCLALARSESGKEFLKMRLNPKSLAI